MEKLEIISWWSGGITSAVTCKLCIDQYGLENVRIIFIDTHNEDEDTYRFKTDCEKWYGKIIEVITGIGYKYENVQDVWIKNKVFNTATGAACSGRLKSDVSRKWRKENTFDYTAFGFDLAEAKRALAMKMNHPDTKPIFPLMFYGISKKDCIKIVEDAGVTIPRTYLLGYKNNNCFKTGCVQGGIGYWQKIKREYPLKFEAMASMEHELTEINGKPTTMLKDQSNESKSNGIRNVFLKKHLKYPQFKTIDDMKECKVDPLFECNGFCGINDLDKRSKTEEEINFE